MRNIFAWMALCAAVVWGGTAFAVEAVAPAKGAVVPLLSEKQKAFMQMSHDERLVFFDDAQEAKEKKITTFGDRPLPVRLEWKGGTPTYQVNVMKQGASWSFFSASIPSNSVAVWNLEDAATYVWRVAGADGATVVSSLATEAQAPRLIYIPGDAARSHLDALYENLQEGRRDAICVAMSADKCL